jgi:regulator of cell morphogenesis and NO signaling
MDYRTAEVFRKHGIEYCCGGKWPLSTVCMIKGLEMDVIKRELEKAMFSVQIPSAISFHEWNTGFLVDYIVNIHHYYIRQTFPVLQQQLDHFVEEHLTKDPSLAKLKAEFDNLEKQIFPHLQQEEEIIFPYIRRVAHAYSSKESYASLLVKTLRKPIVELMDGEHAIVFGTLYEFRKLTNNYTAPAKACTSQRVIWSKLKELDNDLVQHLYLENEVLFPRVLAMEKEIL